MSTATSSRHSVGVFARWRPLTESEAPAGEIGRSTSQKENSLLSISITHGNSSNDRPWKSPLAFRDVLNPQDNNSVASDTVVSRSLRALEGGTCSFFAYGHSGSGKTHTIIGATDEKLAIGFSLYELRKNSAFDLLNGRVECHIRQGHDGKTHIRGPTEMLENGKVRVRPIVQRPCWTYDALGKELLQSLGLRAVGSSSVPMGKRATDISVEEYSKGVVLLPGGGWTPNPDYQTNQARIDMANAEKAECEARVTAAHARVSSILSSDKRPGCLGGRLAFVGLACAEYQRGKSSTMAPVSKQTVSRASGGSPDQYRLACLEGGHSRLCIRSKSHPIPILSAHDGAT